MMNRILDLLEKLSNADPINVMVWAFISLSVLGILVLIHGIMNPF